MQRTFKTAGLSFTAFLLAGCAVLEPRYEQPALPTPEAWPQGAAYTTVNPDQTAQTLPDWRAFFADPKLQGVIALALENNRDLRVAALNIERAQSQYHVQRAQSLPNLAATASGSVGRTPAALSSTGADLDTRQYSGGATLTSFEIDLFGRVRSLNRAALQTYLGTQAARDTVQISLISDVATTYFNLASDLEQLRLAQSTLASQRESLNLTQQRFEAGASSQLDVRRAQTTVETARADVARYTTLVAQDQNALAFIVGAPVPEQLQPIAIADIAFGVEELPPGLPSEVLLTRPDILEAEHTLRSANANIGAARAAFFPSVTIAGFGGQADPRFENLFSGAGGSWSFTPQVSIPIFSGGRNFANLGIANTDRDIAIARYEQSIQSAFREVADALAERGTIEEQVAARQALAEAASDTYRLSEARYREGVDSYLSLLDAQREMYAAQQNLVSARASRAVNFVTLYKTLGGGL